MRRHRDEDLVLVESMLAPPPLDDARSSLEYWRQREKTLPRYRRAARSEAREMAARWEARLEAAERVRFESSLPGRVLRAVGVSGLFLWRVRPTKGRLLLLAWALVPRRIKLVAGAVVAVWLVAAAATMTVMAAVIAQLA
jgi:hypothetical protein